MLSPWSLFFLAAIPLVVVLYLLRLRRKELVVSSTMFWPEMIQDMQANTPFQRLRKNILMFLQIAIIILVAFALARPFLRWHARTADNTVLILDASASMQASDERGSRLDAAKRAAAQKVDDMSRNDRAMVIAAGAKPKVLSSFTTDKRALKAAIGALKPCDGRADMRSAVVLGASLMEAEQQDRQATRQIDILILSDGAFDPLDDLPIGPAQLHFVKFGRGADNVGITAFDARHTYGTQVKDQLFVAVTNFSKQEKSLDLDLYHWDSLFRTEELTIAPGETADVVLGDEDLPFEVGVVRAQLDLDDDLAVDNRAYAYLAPRQRLSVLLVSDENVFLEKVLNVKDVIDLASVRPDTFTSADGYDVVVFDSFAPSDPLGPGAYLLVNTDAPGGPVEVSGRVRNPAIVDVQPHPVTKYVTFSNVIITHAKLARAKPWGKVLVEAGNTALVVAGERSDTTCVYVGFPLTLPDTSGETAVGTNFVMRASFPIFMSNVIDWLSRGTTGRENLQTRVGGVAQLRAPEEGSELEVTKPAGDVVRVAVPEGESAVPFDDTDETGVYRAGPEDQQQVFVVNLLSTAESDITPRESVQFGRASVAARGAGGTANREIWRLLALAGLAVLMVEWYIYHRRF